MSKVLADEYKKLADSDIPDLWNRIEAGLKEKTVSAASESGDESPVIYQYRRSFLRRYGSLIAALLCVAVIIPVIYFNRSFHSLNESMPAPASMAEYNIYSAADIAAPEEVAPAAIPESAVISEEADMVIIEGGELNFDDFSTQASEADSLMRSETESLDDDRAVWDNYIHDIFMNYEEAAGGDIEAQVNGTMLNITAVIVEVIAEISDMNVESGSYFEAVIISDEAAILNPGAYLKFVKDDPLDFAFSTGETYQLDLTFQTDSEYPFTVIKVY